MTFDTYEDLSSTSNEELIDFLREQIQIITNKFPARKIINACFNIILKEVEKRMIIECPHGTMGGIKYCMACRPELMEKAEKERLDMIETEDFLKGEL